MTDKRELTVTAVFLGAILAVVFGAANAYLGLRVGMTVSSSIPAAVAAMGILRCLCRRDSILECNMVQTIGSAGESLAAGVIFTVPAIYLWADEGICLAPGVVPVTLLALAGGLLGVVCMVPIRKLVIEQEAATLIYPEGRACADVLKAGERGSSNSLFVFGGLALAAFLKVATDSLKWIPAALAHPFRTLRGEIGLELSPAMFGVGFIVGPKVSLIVFSGSLLAWMGMIPLFTLFSDAARETYAQGGAVLVWRQYVRFVGAGAIAVGGFLSLLNSVPALVGVFKAELRKKAGLSESASGADLPLKPLLLAAVAILAILVLLPIVPVSFCGAILIALFGFFFAAVSARMVGLTGSSNNPASGMTIATLVVSTLVLKLTGSIGATGMLAAMSVGCVVCIIAAMAGDMAQDLKTGQLVGATPWKQQVGEVIGSVAAALAIATVLTLLHKAFGFGSDAIPAPQATLMKVMVEGVMNGGAPWHLIGIGAAIAVVVRLCRIPVMPFAIGMYLPIKVMAAVFVGGMSRLACNRLDADWSARGNLLSAGLVAGEGICGIILACLVLAGGK